MAKIRNNDGSVTTFHDVDDGGVVIAKEQNIDQLIDAIKGYEDFSEAMEADIRNTVARYIERVGK